MSQVAEVQGFDTPSLGVGIYTVGEAARLLKIPARNIRRWLSGYAFGRLGDAKHMPPLWSPELPVNRDHIELGFRDLIELRFVHAFIASGVGLQIVRRCLEHAQEITGDRRPFSTRRFKTDGRTIFLESIQGSGEAEVMDLKQGQFVIRTVLERSFRDLDIDGETVARWRPFQSRSTIVVDPQRAFGQPITNEAGVPTVALKDAVEAEGSAERVARLYEVSLGAVRDSVEFERFLHAA